MLFSCEKPVKTLRMISQKENLTFDFCYNIPRSWVFHEWLEVVLFFFFTVRSFSRVWEKSESKNNKIFISSASLASCSRRWPPRCSWQGAVRDDLATKSIELLWRVNNSRSTTGEAYQSIHFSRFKSSQKDFIIFILHWPRRRAMRALKLRIIVCEISGVFVSDVNSCLCHYIKINLLKKI